MSHTPLLLTASATLVAVLCLSAAPAPTFPLKLDLAKLPADAFDSPVTHTPAGTTSTRPFSVSTPLPEGIYRVRVQFTGTLSVKAESRQLLALHATPDAQGGVEFLVFTRTPAIPGGTKHVKVKVREQSIRRWDDKLNLEFCGPAPKSGGAVVSSVTVTPAPADTRVVYVVGDSTVADQSAEPWASWGQMLPVFLDAGVAVANHAESGESFPSFLGADRWTKILATLKAGDVVLIQMGHNDQKIKGENVGAFTTYKANLERFVAETKAKGATPVLITSVNRRTFEGGKVTNSLGDFPAAVRLVAKEQSVPLIDLQAASGTLYEALGPDGSGALFVDKTHHNNYGAYLLARCVAEGLKADPNTEPLLRPGLPLFDPAHPPTAATLALPQSLERDPTKPDGN